jgi:hypothetical protein
MDKLTILVGVIALSASPAHSKVYADLEQLDLAKESYDFVVVGGLFILNPSLRLLTSLTSNH